MLGHLEVWLEQVERKKWVRLNPRAAPRGLLDVLRKQEVYQGVLSTIGRSLKGPQSVCVLGGGRELTAGPG